MGAQTFPKTKRGWLKAKSLAKKKKIQGFRRVFIDSNPGGYIVVWHKS